MLGESSKFFLVLCHFSLSLEEESKNGVDNTASLIVVSCSFAASSPVQAKATTMHFLYIKWIATDVHSWDEVGVRSDWAGKVTWKESREATAKSVNNSLLIKYYPAHRCERVKECQQIIVDKRLRYYPALCESCSSSLEEGAWTQKCIK